MNQPAPVLLTAQQLNLAWPGEPPLFAAPLSFTLRPGLAVVQGGEMRGKTTLLQLIAGDLQPSEGQLRRAPGATVFFEQPTEPELDDTVARQWLTGLRLLHPGWRVDVEAALAAAFRLDEHLDKPFYMLSAGSRRKVGLLAAAASGATLTLLDTPYAALDAASCKLLTELLAEAAAGDSGRAWVLADYALPAGLDAATLMARVDLGD